MEGAQRKRRYVGVVTSKNDLIQKVNAFTYVTVFDHSILTGFSGLRDSNLRLWPSRVE